MCDESISCLTVIIYETNEMEKRRGRRREIESRKGAEEIIVSHSIPHFFDDFVRDEAVEDRERERERGRERGRGGWPLRRFLFGASVSLASIFP